MSDLAVRYSFEPSTINGNTVSNDAYGAKQWNATLSSADILNNSTYLVGTQAIQIQNTNTFVTLPNITDLGSSITISLWVYLAKPPGDNAIRRVFEIRNDALRLFVSIDNFNNILFSASSTRYTFINYTLPNNEWTHIVWVIQPTSWKMFANNIMNVFSVATNFNGTINSAFSFIGKGVLENSFIGFIDDFRIYRVALSNDQIYEIYDKTTFTHYYRFEPNDISYNANANTYTVSNLNSGFPVLDAPIISATNPTFAYGSSNFKLDTTVFKSGASSMYSSGNSGNYITMSTLNGINSTGFTMSVWFYPTTNASSQIISSVGNDTYQWVIMYEGNGFSLSLYYSTAPSTPPTLLGKYNTQTTYPNGYLLGSNKTPNLLRYGGNASATPNNWYHIAWSVSKTFWKIQINGEMNNLYSPSLMSSGQPISDVLVNLPTSSLTSNYLYGSVFQIPLTVSFAGYIDEFRIYNRQLTYGEKQKIFHYRCLRTNFYSPDNTDLIHLFNSGNTTSSSIGFGNETGDDIQTIFNVYNPSLTTPQISIPAHLISPNTLHIANTATGGTNVNILSQIQYGQIVSSTDISGNPYVIGVDNTNNSVLLSKNVGNSPGVSGDGYAGYYDIVNGLLTLYVDKTNVRSYSGNAPMVGDLLYWNGKLLASIKEIYDYLQFPVDYPDLPNGYFSIPLIATGRFVQLVSPYSQITSWTIAGNATIYIANKPSTIWSYPTLPTDIANAQWLIIQSKGLNTSSTITRTVNFNTVSSYILSYYLYFNQADSSIQTNTFSVNINGYTQTIYPGMTGWINNTLYFVSVEGGNALNFTVSFGDATASAVYLAGVNILPAARPTASNIKPYLQYSILLSDTTINVPKSSTSNIEWRNTKTVSFYTPTEFTKTSNYYLLSGLNSYDDYVYKLSSSTPLTTPFIINGDYTITNHQNGYYTIQFTGYGSIRFIQDVFNIQLLIVGSGGAGGKSNVISETTDYYLGGGGGQGGQVNYYPTYYVLPNISYNVEVGESGLASSSTTSGGNGSPSFFGNEMAMGGVGGSMGTITTVNNITTIQGGAGGVSSTNGGAGGNGSSVLNGLGSNGGNGISVSFGVNGTAHYGGGGGGGWNGLTTVGTSTGGLGGGGSNENNGTQGTGGGGGGANGSSGTAGGNGGKGTVLIYVGAPPDPPSSLIATKITNTTIAISFKASQRVATQYTVVATPINNPSASTLSYSWSNGNTYTIRQLIQSTTYSVFVRATNSVGSNVSNTINVNTLSTISPSPSVQIVSYTNTSVQQVMDIPNVSISNYYSYFTTIQQPAITLPTYYSTTNTITINDLSKNTFYSITSGGNTEYGNTNITNTFIKTKNIPPPITSIILSIYTSSEAGINFVRPPLNDGVIPLLYYIFDTNTSNGNNVANIGNGTAVYDASMLNATLNFSNYRVGNGSLYCSSTQGYPLKINKTLLFSGYDTITVSLWVFPRRFYTAFENPYWIFSFNNVFSENRGLIYGLRFNNNGTISMCQGNQIFDIPVNIPINTWTHLGVVQKINTSFYETGTMTVYVNGVLRHTNSSTNVFSNVMTASLNYLGSQNDGNAFEDGFIDDFRFYESGLTGTQIASIYNNTFGLIPPLNYYIIYYTSITNYSNVSLLGIYRIHPNYVKPNGIYNLYYEPPALDASLVNVSGLQASTLTNNYELLLNSYSQSHIILPSFTILTRGYSFICWFRLNTNTNGSHIFYLGNSSSTVPYFQGIRLFIQDNQLYFSLHHTMTSLRISTTNVNNNTYNHIAFIIGASSGGNCVVNVYLNGTVVYTSPSLSYPTIVSRTKCYVGKSIETTDPYLNGSIYELFLWNRAINANEVSYLYNNYEINMETLQINDIASPTFTTIISNLLPRNKYSFVISCVNNDGEAFSEPNIFRTLNTPDTPTNFVVYDVTDTTATFNFDEPFQYVSHYSLVLKTFSIVSNTYTTAFDLSFTSLNIPYFITDLSKNTTYYTFLYANNEDGTSPPATLSFTTYKEPDPPTNLTITTIGNTFISIIFTDASGYNVLYYEIYAIPESGSTIAETFNYGISSYTLDGLSGGNKYTLYLVAVNIYGTSPYATVEFETSYVTDAPTDLALTSRTTNSLTFSFTSPPQNFTNYKLYIQPTYPTTFRNISFTNFATPYIQPLNTLDITLSQPGNTRLVFLATEIGLRYLRILGGVWGNLFIPNVNYNITPSMNTTTACSINPSGTRLVVSFGLSGVYWADTTGLMNGLGNNLYFTRILDNTPRICYGLAISSDSSAIVLNEYNGFVYYSVWNGNNYSTFTQTQDTTKRYYNGIDISRDKNKIVMTANTNVYWAVWNGTNYSVNTQINGGGVNGTMALGIGFVSKDVDMIAFTSTNGSAQYSVWNYYDGNYDAPNNISTSAIPIVNGYGLHCDASGTIFLSPYTNSNIYTTQISYEKYSPTTVYTFSNTNTSYTVSGLLTQTYYDISLSAVNVYGESLPAILNGSNTL